MDYGKKKNNQLQLKNAIMLENFSSKGNYDHQKLKMALKEDNYTYN